MGFRPASLAELSDLPVELDPKYWRQKSNLSERICNALKIVESGYAEQILKRTKSKLKARVFRKLFDALSFFRRSFRQTADSTEGVVNLAIAFEVLLTDSYSRGIDDHIHRRASLALKGVRGRSSMLDSLEGLYKARSEYVHAGRTNTNVDVDGARKAFTRAFLELVERLDKLPQRSSQPIGTILGDVNK